MLEAANVINLNITTENFVVLCIRRFSVFITQIHCMYDYIYLVYYNIDTVSGYSETKLGNKQY